MAGLLVDPLQPKAATIQTQHCPNSTRLCFVRRTNSPGLVCRSIAAQFIDDNSIALFAFGNRRKWFTPVLLCRKALIGLFRRKK